MKLKAVVALAVACWAGDARADDAAGAAGFLVYFLQAAAPNEVGVELSSQPERQAVVRLVWSNQLALGVVLGVFGCFGSNEHELPLFPHRIVVSLALAVGDESPQRANPFVGSPGQFRFGYRYRSWHKHRLAPFVGVGASTESPSSRWQADWRWAFSPEVGLHIGSARIGFPQFQLRIQGDMFPTDLPRERVLVTGGFTFF